MSFQIQLSTKLNNHTKHIADLEQVVIRPILQLVVKAIEQYYVDDGALELISKNFNVSQDIVDEWYAAIFTIVKLHLRSSNLSIKPSEFKQCLEDLKFSPECIQDIFSVVMGAKRFDLIKGLSNRLTYFPFIVACKWRIDVIISSSSVCKVMKPRIIMEWILSNNETYTFEISVPQFYQLQNSIGEILKELNRLDTYKIIQNYATN